MSLFNEIGGYFELECGNSPAYYTSAVLLNSARNALRYIVRAYNIKKIHVPYYTCPVVWDVLREEGCNFVFYHIDKTLSPSVDFQEDDFILYNNYFGVCTDKVKILAQKYKFLIVDNAQSFFSAPTGLASFYSPRKFFGLPDGGLVFSDKRLDDEFATDKSYERCSHLLKRWDEGATLGYPDFKKNEQGRNLSHGYHI